MLCSLFLLFFLYHSSFIIKSMKKHKSHWIYIGNIILQ